MEQTEEPIPPDSQCCRRGFIASLTDTATRILADSTIAPQSIAKERLAICKQNDCGFFNSKTEFCEDCGCFLPLKVKMANMRCPKDYWLEWVKDNQNNRGAENDY